MKTPLARGASAVLEAAGWTTRLSVPDDLERCVVIGAPHTSNWDLALTLLVGAQIDLQFYWLGKQSLFRPPTGRLMRSLGGVPVDRSSSRNAVDQLAETLRTSDRMALVVAPEATRSRSEYWRSGFYYIAREAGVPLVLGYVDYRRREAGLGRVLDPVGEIAEVMDALREFYRDKIGLYPERGTPPRLRTEEE